jgi:gamma-glutamyltranspeptidase/glutathione hydrolase
MKVSINDLFSEHRANELRSRIEMGAANNGLETAPARVNAPLSATQPGITKKREREYDTEYVAAADAEGNLVSFIQSNFMGFGSGVVEPETAIILQNRGHLFSLDENHANCIAPHKRCVHTLMPGMILRSGKAYAALGLKGGHVQPQVQVQIICNLVDFGMTVQQAIAAARFNHIEAEKASLEPEMSQAVTDELARRGHKIVSASPESFGGAHAIVVDPESGAFIGGSDPRKGGCALGF